MEEGPPTDTDITSSLRLRNFCKPIKEEASPESNSPLISIAKEEKSNYIDSKSDTDSESFEDNIVKDEVSTYTSHIVSNNGNCEQNVKHIKSEPDPWPTDFNNGRDVKQEYSLYNDNSTSFDDDVIKNETDVEQCNKNVAVCANTETTREKRGIHMVMSFSNTPDAGTDDFLSSTTSVGFVKTHGRVLKDTATVPCGSLSSLVNVLKESEPDSDNHSLHGQRHEVFVDSIHRATQKKVQNDEGITSTHTEGKPYKCVACGKAFVHKHSLGRHSKIHAGEKSYKCVTCGRSFTQQSNLKRHEITHDTHKGPYQCSNCGTSFKRKTELKSHQTIHLECYGKGLNYMLSTQGMNKRSHIGEQPNTKISTRGGKSLKKSSKSCLNKTHSAIHTDEKSYDCSTCGKVFLYRSYMEIHARIHSGEKPYNCSTCGKSFARRDSCNRHEMIHSSEHLYKCSTCGKTFAQGSTLYKHKFIHTGQRPHKCPMCGKSFARSSTLNEHKLTHSGEKPHKCLTCGKSFSRRSHRNAHQLIHTGLKLFKCCLCGKSFTLRSSLYSHKITHAAEKPFNCLTCGKSFTRRSSLNSHKLMHARQSENLSLNERKMLHSVQKPYSCQFCDLTFSQKHYLTLHVRGRHQNQTVGEKLQTQEGKKRKTKLK